MALGSYPQTSLIQAREASLKAKKLLAAGQDPGHLRKLGKLAIREGAAHTFETVAREWHGNYKSGWAVRHAANILFRLENDAFPKIGSLPISQIDAQALLRMAREIEGRGAHDIARRTLQMCSQVFTYAIGHGWADSNPAIGLNKLLKPFKKEHFPSIDISELPAFLKKLDSNEARLHLQTILGTKLLMLTLARTSELIGARWDEFTVEQGEWVWNIPASRMKMRRAHCIPLPRQAVVYLERLMGMNGQSPFVFPSVSKPGKTMSNATILGAIKRIGYKGKMTGHGFRSLGMTTIKEKLRYPHEVVDRQLAHSRDKIAAAYDRSEFIEQRKQMLQEWADYIDQITGNGTVVSFARKQAA